MSLPVKKEETAITNEVSIQTALIEIVKRTDIDPERLEKFLDLQIKMEERQAAKALNSALADFQSKCPIIKRTKLGHNQKKYAPFEDLIEQIQGLLFETGLSYSFDVEPTDEKTYCMKAIIRHKMGAHFVSPYYFPKSDASGNKNEAQGIRSANSYAKRTCLENALGIATSGEDNDGGRTPTEMTTDQLAEINRLVKETGSDVPRLLKFLKAESLEKLTGAQARTAIHALNQKGKK